MNKCCYAGAGRERLIKVVLWRADSAPTPATPENFFLFISLSLLTEHFHWVLESLSEHRLGKRNFSSPTPTLIPGGYGNLLLGLTSFTAKPVML